MKQYRILYVTFIVLLSSISMATILFARPYGYTGRSGKDGSTCSGCHIDGSQDPTLNLTGPTTVLAGQTINYSFVVAKEFVNDNVTKAGFNVAVSDGILMPGDGTPEECPEEGLTAPAHSDPVCFRDVNGSREVSHAQPAVLANDQAVFDFQWTAPITATGVITLYGAGVTTVPGGGIFDPFGQAYAHNTTFEITVLHGAYLPLVVSD